MAADPALTAAVASVVTATLSFAVGTPLWNRAATKRQLAAAAGKTTAEQHVLVADAAIRIMREAVERSERAEQRADEAHAIASQALDGNRARDAHVAALRRQIINGDPPPPCDPPIAY